MAEPKLDTKPENSKLKTWQEKLENGEPLNSLEETKADADFNVKQRVKEQAERAAFEARKAATRIPSQSNQVKESR